MNTLFKSIWPFVGSSKLAFSFSTVCYFVLGAIFAASLSVLSSADSANANLLKKATYNSVLPNIIHPAIQKKLLEEADQPKRVNISIEMPTINVLDLLEFNK